MPYISTDSIHLYYEREGKGNSLILIEGYGTDLSIWDLVRKPLAQHFELIVLDNRGSGKTTSSSKKFSIKEMAEDVLELIRQLKLDKPHLLGHSMGGAIAQTVALHYPEQIGKLILAQTLIKLTPLAKAVLNTILHLREQGVSTRLQTEVVMPWLFSNTLMKNSYLCNALMKEMEKQALRLSLEGQKLQCKALESFDSSSWYAKINSPTLICAAEEDLLTPLSESHLLHRGIKNSQLYIFKQIGHMAPIERAEEFCTVVSDFLGRSPA